MAGIGFELRKMIDQRTGFGAKVRAYACAGLISSGPWLMTILTLTLLNLAGPYLSGTGGYSLFRALVTYSFAFSLILQGIGQMAITRRIADLLYAKQYQRVLPAFVTALAVTGLLHVALGAGFCWYAGFPPALSAVAVALFAIIGMTWTALVWLSVAREYDQVLRAYVYGTLIAMLGMVVLSIRAGTVGVLSAYTAGQAFTLMLLVRTILRGMEAGGERDWSVLSGMARFPRLIAFGLFYNVAIWLDKMIFWFRDGIGPHPFVRYHPLYDTCSFLAYLTVVPALAVNLVRLETSFYEHYRAYYSAILGGTPLRVVEEKRDRMFENLQESTIRLLRVQGAITILVIIFAPFIIDLLKLPPVAVRLFRLTCLGAFFHVLLLITILMQLYFDRRTHAMVTSLVFLVLNGGLAWWSVSHGVETYGIGYAIASFLSLLLGYTLLHRSLEKLDYLTFTSQPIAADPVAPAGEAEAKAAADAEEEEAETDEAEEPVEEPVTEVAPDPPEPVVEPATAEAETLPETASDELPATLDVFLPPGTAFPEEADEVTLSGLLTDPAPEAEPEPERIVIYPDPPTEPHREPDPEPEPESEPETATGEPVAEPSLDETQTGLAGLDTEAADVTATDLAPRLRPWDASVDE